MLDYAAVAALAAVVREGSFDAAARTLHVTPSAVSQRIRSLEERMGCTLVQRGQPCRATAVGQRLCQHLDRVHLLEQELAQALPLPGLDAGARVTLRVAVNADSLATWFAPVASGYAAQAPVLMDLSIDDEGHTVEWLRSGAVLAAVSAQARAPGGCNSEALGSMRYVAAAGPGFVAAHFPDGVHAASLARAPCLVFNAQDELQARWVRRRCRRDVDLPRHVLPSPQGFVAAALAGMGWGMHPLALVASHLRDGTLVELVEHTPLDIALHWHYARAASRLLDDLTREVRRAARGALLPARSP